MFFVLTGHFRSDAEPGAAQYQRDLNEHLGQLMTKVRLAGPLRDREGRETGFMVCLEADGFDAALAYLDHSPYFKAGLYDRIDLAEFAIEVGAGQLRQNNAATGASQVMA